jgi:hypothetical protein
MIVDLLKYFLVSLFAIAWFYCCGLIILHRVLKVNSSSIASGTLLNLLTGIVIHVILFAIYKTHFATLNILLLGILLTIYFSYRKQNKIPVSALPVKIYLREIFELFFIALVFSVLRILNVIDSDLYPYYHVSRDDMFYSNVSYFISHYGVESFYLDWSSETSSLGIIPYHYFELWLNALISEVTGFLNLAVYYFITSLLLTILFYQTILMIISELLKKELSLKYKLLAFFLIFMGDLFFGLISNQTFPNLTIGYSLYDNFKMLLVFIVIALAWKAWKLNYFYISFMVLLIVPLLNYGLMPVILFTVPVFFALHSWVLKLPELIPYKKILLSYAAYLVALVLIQKLFSNDFKGVTTLGPKELIAYYNEFSKVKTVGNYMINYIIAALCIVLPYLFILIPIRKNNLLAARSGFYILFLMFLLSALALSALLHFLIDTSQLFIITMNVTTHLFLFCSIPLVLFHIEKSKLYKGIILVFLISGIVMLANKVHHKGSEIKRYSDGFLDKVRLISDKIEGQGVRYLTPDYYYSVYNINPNCNYEGFYLSFFKNDVVIHTVTIDQIPDKEELHDFFNYNRDLIIKSSYYLNSTAKMGLDTADKEAIQMKFIKNNNIDLL